MRVAYVNADPGVPAFGTKGCSVHVQEMLRAMLLCGAEVELLTSQIGGEPPLDLAAISVQTLSPLPAGDESARECAALAANQEIAQRLALGNFDLVYERYSLWSHAGMEFARQAGLPGVLEVNAPLIEEQSAHRSLNDRAAAESVAHRAFSAATLICAVSDEVAAYVSTFDPVAAKIIVIPNAVNPARFDTPSPAQPARQGVFTIGFVGSLKPWHGMEALAEAFAVFHGECRASRLLVVGDGTVRVRMQEDFRSRGLAESVVFTGAVSPAEVPSFLASMDVAVAPYPQLDHFYFSPLKVFEYMAAGLPVIASRIGQIEKLIEHGVTGWLVSPGDPMALTAAMKILAEKPSLRTRIGQEARTFVLKHHTWERSVRQVFDLAFATAKAPHTANS
jgi:glycosyltransferase involved in cell wall biosynthesis